MSDEDIEQVPALCGTNLVFTGLGTEGVSAILMRPACRKERS